MFFLKKQTNKKTVIRSDNGEKKWRQLNGFIYPANACFQPTDKQLHVGFVGKHEVP